MNASPESLELLQVELETSLGQFTLSGTLGPAPAYIGSKLDVHLDGGNANSVMSVFGIDALPEEAFNLNARVEVVKNGLLVERGVLVTKEDQRLEVDGFVALDSGSKGTNLELKISANNLAQVLERYVGSVEVPDKPFELSGRVQIKDEGIGLNDMKFDFEAIQLKADGLIKLDNELSGTSLDFQLSGEDLSALRKFQAIGNSLDMFVEGQPYQATGRFTVEKNAWKLSEVNGRVGQTALNFDALISKQQGLAGSNIRLSVNGPGLDSLLVKKGESGLPKGAFETSAKIGLSDKKLSIDKLRFKTLDAHGEIDLELGWPISGKDDFKFNANVQGGDIRNFLPPMKSFEAEMAAFHLIATGNKQGDLVTVDKFESSVGNLQVLLKGKVDANNPEVAFHVLSEDISQLGRFNGKPLPALPLDIKADFKGNEDQITFRNLVGSLGESSLNGELDVSLKGSKPDIKLTATSDYLDIRPFIEQKKPDTETDTTTKPDRLIPATPLPLDALASKDLHIKLNIGEIRYWQDSITDVILNVEQRNGRLNISQLSYEAPLGNLHASLSINPTGSDKADVKIDLGAQDFVVNLSGLPEEKLDKVPAFDVDFHASGNGANIREVAGNLNGSLYMASKGGSAENVDLSLLETFLFDQLFSVIMPKSQENLNTQFSCIAASLQISDGQVTTNPAIAFTSQKVAVITKGALDLKTEKMNFNFNSTPTNALQINPGEMFHPYILISGSLAKPAVGIDPGKAALHGGAAIATMGISILAKGVLDRAGNAIPICEEMLNNPPKN
ncbi:AsmA-like C-terminal region-containing protein [Pseudomonadota bacterium]